MYMELPLFIHTINLVRWYALYRNKGKYNKDTYFSSLGQIRRIMETQSSLLSKGKRVCPTLEMINKSMQATETVEEAASPRKQATLTIAAQLDEPLYDIEEENEREKYRNENTMHLAIQKFKDLPIILPEVMEEEDQDLNEMIIQDEF